MAESRTEKSNSGPPLSRIWIPPPPLSEISGSAPARLSAVKNTERAEKIKTVPHVFYDIAEVYIQQ